MTTERLYHSVRLLLLRAPKKRAEYLRRNRILAGIGENVSWGPWFLPLYPKLIKVHNNVTIHKTVHIVTHDVVNAFLKKAHPDMDFGWREVLGCVEIMDNVNIAMNVTIMPNVRIGKDCIISAGSVVNADIPDNTIAAGNPAVPIGRTDMFIAMRRMSKGSHPQFKNQELPDELAEKEWDKFYAKHDRAKKTG